MQYAVFYASAGCLPDSDDIPTFDTKYDAASYVLDLYLDEYEEEHGTRDGDYVLADVLRMMGANNPRPNSLYAWSIEPVTHEQVEEA